MMNRLNILFISLFNRYFSYKTPDEMVQALYNSKSKTENNSIWIPIMDNFDYFVKKTEQIPKDVNKDQVEILNIVTEILKFNELILLGQGLKMLTPSQRLSRLLISLAQLKVENNSEKLKNEIRQILYFL